MENELLDDKLFPLYWLAIVTLLLTLWNTTQVNSIKGAVQSNNCMLQELQGYAPNCN